MINAGLEATSASATEATASAEAATTTTAKATATAATTTTAAAHTLAKATLTTTTATKDVQTIDQVNHAIAGNGVILCVTTHGSRDGTADGALLVENIVQLQ